MQISFLFRIFAPEKRLMRRYVYIAVWLALAPLVAPSAMRAESGDLHVAADRPGAGTGTNVLDRGFVQWESGIEVAHWDDVHLLTLPTSLLRFGVCRWAELRLEYTGVLAVDDKESQNKFYKKPRAEYYFEPLWLGAKFGVWGGSDEQGLCWIPRTSVMVNVGLPLTSQMAADMPVSGKIDVLFENDLTNWLTLGYELGVYWELWIPEPTIFAALNLNFAVNDKVGLFVESFNNFAPEFPRPVAYGEDASKKHYFISNANLDLGATFLVHPRLQLDIYAGCNLFSSLSSYAMPSNSVFVGMGVSWLIAGQEAATKQASVSKASPLD